MVCQSSSQLLNFICQYVRFAVYDTDGRVFIAKTIQNLDDVAARRDEVNNRRTYSQDIVYFTGMANRARKLHEKLDHLAVHWGRGFRPRHPGF